MEEIETQNPKSGPNWEIHALNLKVTLALTSRNVVFLSDVVDRIVDLYRKTRVCRVLREGALTLE